MASHSHVLPASCRVHQLNTTEQSALWMVICVSLFLTGHEIVYGQVQDIAQCFVLELTITLSVVEGHILLLYSQLILLVLHGFFLLYFLPNSFPASRRFLCPLYNPYVYGGMAISDSMIVAATYKEFVLFFPFHFLLQHCIKVRLLSRCRCLKNSKGRVVLRCG